MDHKGLQIEINKNIITSAYLFIAGERYIAMSYIKLIRDKIITGEYALMNLSIFDEKKIDASSLEGALYQLPVMSERRFVLIKCESLSALSQNERAAGVISEYIKSGSRNATLIVLTPKADKRLSLYKSFSSGAKVVEFTKLTDRELYAWISNTISKKGFKISDKAINKLIACADYNSRESGIDLGYLKNEIDKLCSFGQGKEITDDIVDRISSVNVTEDIFKFTDSILMGDDKNALEAMYKLTYNRMPFALILYNIARTVANNALWKSAAEKGASAADIAKKYGANPYIVKKTLQKSKMSAAESLRALSVLNKIDMSVKSSKLKEDGALIILTKRLCSPAKL